jgi:hypothetical protein
MCSAVCLLPFAAVSLPNIGGGDISAVLYLDVFHEGFFFSISEAPSVFSKSHPLSIPLFLCVRAFFASLLEYGRREARRGDLFIWCVKRHFDCFFSRIA